jgi:phage gp46-like protein
MDTLLQNGDHAVNPSGLPAAVTGTGEIIQRAMLRLGLRRGSFPYDRSLGSELHLLSREDSGAARRAAQSYVQEALLPLPGLRVEDVQVTIPAPGELRLAVTLFYQGEGALVELGV